MSDHEENEPRSLSRRTVLAGVAAGPVLLAAATSGARAQNAESTGKVAIVTGSSRGIGAAIARRLAADGFAVTVNCVVNRDLAAGVVSEIEAAGGRAIWEQADVSDPAAVRRLFDISEQAFGGVDVVINNAGIMRLATFAEMTDEDFGRMTDVNQKGGFHTLREASRRVRDGGELSAPPPALPNCARQPTAPMQPRRWPISFSPVFSLRNLPAGISRSMPSHQAWSTRRCLPMARPGK